MGERQRLSIARAFLKNAPILILDEITASLDAENEKRIQESLNRLIEPSLKNYIGCAAYFEIAADPAYFFFTTLWFCVV